MTRKWGIYWRPLLIGLDKIKLLVEVVARLHNFCINERIEESGGELVVPVLEANIVGREIFQETAEALAEYEALAKELPGYSGNRSDMAKWREILGLSRTKLA
jgi:hypothetical protein